MPIISNIERQLRKIKGVWGDVNSDAVVASGETLIAELHRSKILNQMDDSNPVIRTAKATK